MASHVSVDTNLASFSHPCDFLGVKLLHTTYRLKKSKVWLSHKTAPTTGYKTAPTTGYKSISTTVTLSLFLKWAVRTIKEPMTKRRDQASSRKWRWAFSSNGSQRCQVKNQANMITSTPTDWMPMLPKSGPGRRGLLTQGWRAECTSPVRSRERTRREADDERSC